MTQLFDPSAYGRKLQTELCHSRNAPIGEAVEADNTLAEFLRALVLAGPPPARAKPPPPAPVDRVWRPSDPNLPDVPPGRITRRHPEFAYAFQDQPTMRIKQAQRAARGRQGRFHSRKMNRKAMRARANNEFYSFLLFEADPDVEAFVEHPVQLVYWLDGKRRRHTPDVFVRSLSQGDGFIEIKYEKDASQPDNERRWPAIGGTFARMGYFYLVLTERHIRQEPRFSNVYALFEDRLAEAHMPPPEVLTALMLYLRQRGAARIGEVIEAFSAVQRKHVAVLILRGFLEVDLDAAPIGLDTLVHLGRAGAAALP